MSKKSMLGRIAFLILLLTLTAPAFAVTPRLQKEFIADGYSGIHAIGGAVSYAAFKRAGKTELESAIGSFAVATLWEIGDAFKPNHEVYGDWRDEFVTADGFSYSDIIYHMAGTYCAWLVMDSADNGLLLSVAPSNVRIIWRF